MKTIHKSLFLLIISITLLFTSCNNSLDEAACLDSVKKQFPKAKIYTPYEGSNMYFFVTDSINVYKVVTGSIFSSEVTEVVILERKQ